MSRPGPEHPAGVAKPRKQGVTVAECPMCHEDLGDMVTRKVSGITFCHLCSFDVEDMTPAGREALLRLIRDQVKEAKGV